MLWFPNELAFGTGMRIAWFLFLAEEAVSLENGLALTPPMGWLSWERFGCNTDCADSPTDCISETLYTSMADKLVELGLADLGYRYVNIDDCWSEKTRESGGKILPDSQRFPRGMKWLSNYVHSKGLKFGLYTDIGTKTCGGYPGLGDGHMEADIETFVNWGVDSLKVDGCYADLDSMGEAYARLGRFLNSTGRPVLYSCSWPAYDEAHHCENEIDMRTLIRTCNLWRNYDDIEDSWFSVRRIVNFWARNSSHDILVRSAGPGHWNDPDMLLVGDPGLSLSEQRAQFALWAILAAPLYISSDLRVIPDESLRILKNREVININQDPLGKQGYVLSESKPYRIWIRELSSDKGRERVALLFENTATIFGKLHFRFHLGDIGWTDCFLSARDVHAHTDFESSCNDTFNVFVDESSVELFVLTKLPTRAEPNTYVTEYT